MAAHQEKPRTQTIALVGCDRRLRWALCVAMIVGLVGCGRTSAPPNHRPPGKTVPAATASRPRPIARRPPARQDCSAVRPYTETNIRVRNMWCTPAYRVIRICEAAFDHSGQEDAAGTTTWSCRSTDETWHCRARSVDDTTMLAAARCGQHGSRLIRYDQVWDEP